MYSNPKPTNLPEQEISKQAISFAKEIGYEFGEEIVPPIEEYGGKVKFQGIQDYEQSEGGSIVIEGPKDFTIYLSQFTGILRDRFTVAHELGHYVLHSKKGEIKMRAARYGRTKSEWEANIFAAEFLMPEKPFTKYHKLYDKDINRLAARFMVSRTAVNVRIETLGSNF